MQKLEGQAKLLLIYLDEQDWWGNQPLYEAVVQKLRKLDLAGATVHKGILGYGAHNRVNKAGFLGLSQDMPVTITVIDKEEKVRQALPMLGEMIREGLIALVDAEVIQYNAGDPER